MKIRNVATPLLAIFLLGTGLVVFAADQEKSQTQVQNKNRDKIYGSQLMTPQERAEYHANMRNMKTQQERDTYRLEHHKKMQERAHARGMELPDMSSSNGMGSGNGMMFDKNMGSGKGKIPDVGGRRRQQ